MAPSLSRVTPSVGRRTFSVLPSFRNLLSVPTSYVRLELRSLPCAAIARFLREYEPLRHPIPPGLSLTGVRLAIPRRDMGLRVLRASLVYMPSPLPRRSDSEPISLASRAISAFPERVVGSACATSFSRPAQRSLALRPAHSRRHPFVARFIGGFSHFVTSITAPVASGWSGRRVGFAPTEKSPHFHGAHP
jgi:hypothetical protein